MLEAGSGPGASVREWGHVRLFSPWKLCINPAAKEMLEEAGWTPPPPDELPTGDDLVQDYLAPLARLPELRARIRYRHRVTGVTRVGRDRLKGRSDRSESPFVLRYESDGEQGELRARAVIDASGTWTHPRPLGAHGLPALGEEDELAARGALEQQARELVESGAIRMITDFGTRAVGIWPTGRPWSTGGAVRSRWTASSA